MLYTIHTYCMRFIHVLILYMRFRILYLHRMSFISKIQTGVRLLVYLYTTHYLLFDFVVVNKYFEVIPFQCTYGSEVIIMRLSLFNVPIVYVKLLLRFTYPI